MEKEMLMDKTSELMRHIALAEEPFGIFYSDDKPAEAYAPKAGPPISRQLEEAGQIDQQAIRQNFSCIMGNIWLARKKKGCAFISAEQYGCAGGSFYSGMVLPNLRFVEHYVSTGFPGTPMRGERYISSPQAMRDYIAALNPRPAPAPYCVFKPLSGLADGETPEIIVFFVRPEALTGLHTLLCFASGEADCMVSPFGSGCANIISWPLHYLEAGTPKAVLGGLDPSARKFHKTDELTMAIPLELYERMLEAMPESALTAEGAWPNVRKKAMRSNTAWEK